MSATVMAVFIADLGVAISAYPMLCKVGCCFVKVDFVGVLLLFCWCGFVWFGLKRQFK